MGEFRLLTSPQEVALIEKALSNMNLDYDIYQKLKAVHNRRAGDYLLGEIKYLVGRSFVERTDDGFVLTCYGQFVLGWAERFINAVRVIEMPLSYKHRAQSVGGK